MNVVRIDKHSGLLQYAMDIKLPTVKWNYALQHLDNIVIFFKTPNDNIELTRLVLHISQNSGALLKQKICFSEKQIDYPTHLTSPGKLERQTMPQMLFESYKYGVL